MPGMSREFSYRLHSSGRGRETWSKYLQIHSSSFRPNLQTLPRPTLIEMQESRNSIGLSHCSRSGSSPAPLCKELYMAIWALYICSCEQSGWCNDIDDDEMLKIVTIVIASTQRWKKNWKTWKLRKNRKYMCFRLDILLRNWNIWNPRNY